MTRYVCSASSEEDEEAAAEARGAPSASTRAPDQWSNRRVAADPGRGLDLSRTVMSLRPRASNETDPPETARPGVPRVVPGVDARAAASGARASSRLGSHAHSKGGTTSTSPPATRTKSRPRAADTTAGMSAGRDAAADAPAGRPREWRDASDGNPTRTTRRRETRRYFPDFV